MPPSSSWSPCKPSRPPRGSGFCFPQTFNCSFSSTEKRCVRPTGVVQIEVAHSTPSGFPCRIVSNKPAVKWTKKILHWNWCTDKSSSFYTNNGSSCRIASNRPAGWEADEKEQQALGVCLIYECSNHTFVFVFIFVPVSVFVFAFLFVGVRVWIVGQGPGVWSTSVLTTPGFLVVAVEGCIAHGPPPSKQLAAPAFNGTGRQTFREIVHPGDEITPCCKQSSGGSFPFRSDRLQTSNSWSLGFGWIVCLSVTRPEVFDSGVQFRGWCILNVDEMPSITFSG